MGPLLFLPMESTIKAFVHFFTHSICSLTNPSASFCSCTTILCHHGLACSLILGSKITPSFQWQTLPDLFASPYLHNFKHNIFIQCLSPKKQSRICCQRFWECLPQACTTVLEGTTWKEKNKRPSRLGTWTGNDLLVGDYRNSSSQAWIIPFK